MANAMRLDPVRDRVEVVSYVNKYRNLLYNSFERVQLFDDYEQCFEVTTFRLNCDGRSCSTYRGFTATLDMAGIVGAWEHNAAITLRSRWREVHRGRGAPIGPSLELIPVAGTFSTERDMTSVQKLALYAASRADCGKKVIVSARGIDGTLHTLEFVLGDDVQVIVHRAVCSVEHVTLPVDLCGTVEIYQEDGTLLSVYPPGVRTPQYRRYRIHDSVVCPSGVILIRSARSFIPVTEDHEVIEIGDQLVIEAAGKYFKYGEHTTDPKERRAADGYLLEMYRHLDGIQSRERGRESQDTQVGFVKSPRRRRSRDLPGYRRKR